MSILTLVHVQNYRDVFVSQKKNAPAACLVRHKQVIIFKNAVVFRKPNACGMPSTPPKGYNPIKCV